MRSNNFKFAAVPGFDTPQPFGSRVFNREKRNNPIQHPIYAKEGPQTLSEKAARLVAMCRTGIAASDTNMNIDLQECGYGGLFAEMTLISEELSDAPLDVEMQSDPEIRAAVANLTTQAAKSGRTPPANVNDQDGS